MFLIELLQRRKELNARVERLLAFRNVELRRVITKRVNVSEKLDDITADVPLVSVVDLDAAYNDAARKLRMVDTAIQRANHETEVSCDPSVFEDYVPPDSLKDRRAENIVAR